MKRIVNGEVYFTPKQAAEYFNLSLSTIKNYIYAKKLKTLKTPGGHHRISKSELLKTLESNAVHEGRDSEVASARIFSSIMLSIFKALGPAGSLLGLHSQKVSALSSGIAKAMAMKEEDIKRIEMAGLIHDVGQIGIERRILLKSGVLTSKEYESIKNHPRIGKEMLSSVKELKDIADIVSQHHERMDASGYPDGIRGRDIRTGARIISIAEAYDAMVSGHSYKTPVSKDMAIAELMQNRDTQFDGEIVDIFLRTI